jgi:hypothetical protein
MTGHGRAKKKQFNIQHSMYIKRAVTYTMCYVFMSLLLGVNSSDGIKAIVGSPVS